MKELTAKIKNTRDYENLSSIRMGELGPLLRKLVDEADRADKELDILHNCITELYEIDLVYPIIKKALKEIEQL